jgi:phosphotransferase system  glucose/maltose/N-acetylglucosamine-specific IIC component
MKGVHVDTRVARTLGGLAAIVAGLSILFAVLFGVGVGAGVGVLALGVAMLLVEAVIEEPAPGHAGRAT